MVKKTKFLIITLLSILLSASSFSQVSDSLFNLSCEHEDLIILNEEMEVNITGKKIYFMIATVRNNLTIVVKSKKGLAEFQPFILPENLDGLYNYHAPTVRNIDWSYDNISIQEFSAKIKNHNTNNREIEVTNKTKTSKTLDLTGYFGEIFHLEYYLDNIQVGDTIELAYTYEIPFTDNWVKLLSNRIFFHGKYPKKEYSLTWCHSKDLEVDTIFVNNSTPEIELVGNTYCYHWLFSNLPGCIDEPESKPYKTLPYFIFLPQSYDIEYTHYNSYKQEFIPQYFFQSSQKQDKFYIEYWDNVIGNRNKNNVAYKKVADKITAMAPNDTLGMTKMRYFQRMMVDSVKYDPAINYYNHNEDQIRERAGVDLKGKVVKDNNLERIYANISPRLGGDLFTAYPVDSRVGEISKQYTSTVKDNDLMFAIALRDNSLSFVIPKSDKNNYYFEELPFYYEGIPVMLLHYTDFPNRLEKRNFNTNFREYFTPKSSWKDNSRKTQSKVVINLENLSATFKTRIILSGQYSTLTRCIYSSLPIDSTVNPLYHKPIWEVADNVEVTKIDPQHPMIYYPFKTTINVDYFANDLLIENDNSYILKPGSWFNLVYTDGVNNNPRFLDYYPDFIGSDNYTYMLEFDKAVKLVSTTGDLNITNKYGHYSIAVKQVSDMNILLTSNYSILTNIVTKDSIGLVQEINKAINDLDNFEIIIEKIF